MIDFLNRYNLSQSLKNILLLGIVWFLAYETGVGTLKIISEWTLGSIFRNYVPAVIVGVILYSVYVFRDKPISAIIFKKSKFSLKHTMVIFIVASLLGLAVPYFAWAGLLYIPIAIFIVGAFLFASYLMLAGDEFKGLISFIIAFPFLAFIEWEFRYVHFIGSHNFVTVGPFIFSPTNVFVLVMVFVLILRLNYFSEKIYLSAAFMKWFLLWLIVLNSSTILMNNVSKMESLRYIFFGFIIPFLFFILVINSLRNKKDIKLFIWILLLCSVITGFLGIYLHGMQVGFSINELISEYGTLYDVTISPHNRAVSIALSIPISIALFLSINSKQRMKFFGALLIMILLVIMLLTSFSRSSIIGCLVSLLVFMKSKRWQFSLLLGFAFLMIFWPLFEIVFIRFIEIFQGLNASQFWQVISGGIGTRQRYDGWIAAIEMFKDHPIMGIGYNMWETVYTKYGAATVYYHASGDVTVGYIGGAHNQYLQFLAELGLIGLSVFIIFIVSIFREIHKVKKLARDPFYSNVLTGVTGLFVCGLTLSIWGGFFGTQSSYLGQLVLWGSLGLIVVIKRLSLEQTVSEERSLS